jgi:hypothetical protein
VCVCVCVCVCTCVYDSKHALSTKDNLRESAQRASDSVIECFTLFKCVCGLEGESERARENENESERERARAREREREREGGWVGGWEGEIKNERMRERERASECERARGSLLGRSSVLFDGLPILTMCVYIFLR